jgi:hypothetical protein
MRDRQTQPIPLPDLLHGRVLPTPDTVLRARLNRGVWELLVKWTGRSATGSTWEQIKDFKSLFPQVELADELFVDEGGNVVDTFVGRWYSRHAKRGAAPAATSIK